MSATIAASSVDALDALPADIAALIPEDAPELVGVSWVAEVLDLDPGTIMYAIRRGRLPALAIPGARGTTTAHAVRPRDAARLWGRRVLNRRAKAAAETES